MISRLVIVVVLLVGCKREKAASPEPSPSSGSAPGAAPIDARAAPSIDAPSPDAAAVQPPTEAQALEAAKAWVTAAVARKADALVKASALPFRMADAFSRGSCGDGELTTAAEIEAVVACMNADEAPLRKTLGNKKTELEFSATFPDLPAMIAHKPTWRAVVLADQDASHAFVTFIGGHPKYWSDVLYALFAVRLVDGVPKVDGAAFVFSQEGE